jgi:excinuclease UvrABC nuclease subunit
MSEQRHDSDDPNAAIIEAMATHVDALLSCLARLDLSLLPRIEIRTESLYQELPRQTTAIYFLIHPTEGLLYVGKAVNLKSRWKPHTYPDGEIYEALTHSCLKLALEMGGVEIAWWTVPKRYLTIVETLLIQHWSPKWNVTER